MENTDDFDYHMFKESQLTKKKVSKKKHVEVEKTYKYDRDPYSWLENKDEEDKFDQECEIDSNDSDDASNKVTNQMKKPATFTAQSKQFVDYKNNEGQFKVLGDRFSKHSMTRRSEHINCEG
jgi:hypothetical protein